MFLKNDYVLDEDQDIFEFLGEEEELDGELAGAAEDMEDGSDAIAEAMMNIVEMCEVEVKFSNYLAEQSIICAQAEANAVVSEDKQLYAEAEEGFLKKAKDAILGYCRLAKEKIMAIVDKIKGVLNDIAQKIRNKFTEFTVWLDNKAADRKAMSEKKKEIKKGAASMKSALQKVVEAKKALDADVQNAELKGAYEKAVETAAKEANLEQGVVINLNGDPKKVKEFVKTWVKNSKSEAAEVVKAGSAFNASISDIEKAVRSTQNLNSSFLARALRKFVSGVRAIFSWIANTVGTAYGAVKRFLLGSKDEEEQKSEE